MPKDRLPVTPAIRMLRRGGVPFTAHPYKYEDRGGTAAAARQLGVDEHAVIKTLVMEDDSGAPLIVLMHGDRLVSTKDLARAVGAKSVTPCDPHVASKHTGYVVGGMSPFGTKKPLPIYVEASIFTLARVFINAGKRGWLIEIAPEVLVKLLDPVSLSVAR